MARKETDGFCPTSLLPDGGMSCIKAINFIRLPVCIVNEVVLSHFPLPGVTNIEK